MGPNPNPTQTMSLGAHLQELRRRVLLAIGGVAVLIPVGWMLGPWVFGWIQLPLTADGTPNAQLNFSTVMGPIDLRIQLAVAIAIVIGCPWWLYQIGAYVGPGLKRKEKTYAFAFGLVGTVLFLMGIVAGVIMIPEAVRFLLSFTPTTAALLLSPAEYLRFYLQVTIGFGVSFLLPVIMVALNFLGVLSARTLLGGWRIAVILCFALAALINPLPSALPMILQSGVLLALYFAAVGIARVHEGSAARVAVSRDA